MYIKRIHVGKTCPSTRCWMISICTFAWFLAVMYHDDDALRYRVYCRVCFLMMMLTFSKTSACKSCKMMNKACWYQIKRCKLSSHKAFIHVLTYRERRNTSWNIEILLLPSQKGWLCEFRHHNMATCCLCNGIWGWGRPGESRSRSLQYSLYTISPHWTRIQIEPLAKCNGSPPVHLWCDIVVLHNTNEEPRLPFWPSALATQSNWGVYYARLLFSVEGLKNSCIVWIPFKSHQNHVQKQGETNSELFKLVQGLLYHTVPDCTRLNWANPSLCQSSQCGLKYECSDFSQQVPTLNIIQRHTHGSEETGLGVAPKSHPNHPKAFWPEAWGTQSWTEGVATTLPSSGPSSLTSIFLGLYHSVCLPGCRFRSMHLFIWFLGAYQYMTTQINTYILYMHIFYGSN